MLGYRDLGLGDKALLAHHRFSDWLTDLKKLRHTAYPAYWLGGTLGHLGTRIFVITCLWQAVHMSEEAAWVALVGFLYGIPLLPCSPLAGWLGDKKMSRGTLLVGACVLGSLVAGVYSWIVSNGLETKFLLGTATLLMGISFAFYSTSRIALLATILRGNNVFSVASFDLSSTRMMGFFGPVIAGLLLTYYNYTVALAVSALTLAGSAITLAVLKSTLRHQDYSKTSNEKEYQSNWSVDSGKFGGSFQKYLLGDKVVLLLLFMGLLSIPIGMTYLKMTPVFVDKIIKGGPDLYGNLIGMTSAFAAVSGLILSFMSKVNKPSEKCIVATVCFGLSLVLFAYTRSVVMLYLIAGLTGLFQGIFLTIMSATYQSRVPDMFRGRIIGSWGVVWGLLPVATIGAGYLTDLFSVVWVIAASGWFCVVVGLIGAVWYAVNQSISRFAQ
ncbi:MAG: MFS transporter [Chloroflexota bacterium]|nr:MFS transporter [Chloroflexota bacterium]